MSPSTRDRSRVQCCVNAEDETRLKQGRSRASTFRCLLTLPYGGRDQPPQPVHGRKPPFTLPCITYDSFQLRGLTGVRASRNSATNGDSRNDGLSDSRGARTVPLATWLAGGTKPRAVEEAAGGLRRGAEDSPRWRRSVNFAGGYEPRSERKPAWRSR